MPENQSLMIFWFFLFAVHCNFLRSGAGEKFGGKSYFRYNDFSPPPSRNPRRGLAGNEPVQPSCCARAIEEQLVFAAIWAGASAKEAGKRISYQADTSYLGSKFSLGEVTSFLVTNGNLKVLSNENQYAILERYADT